MKLLCKLRKKDISNLEIVSTKELNYYVVIRRYRMGTWVDLHGLNELAKGPLWLPLTDPNPHHLAGKIRKQKETNVFE